MSKYNENWMSEVFQSMKGSERAKPKSQLKIEIENKIFEQISMTISINQIRMYAAVFLLLFAVNFLILRKNDKNHGISYNSKMGKSNLDTRLISNFNLYEE